RKARAAMERGDQEQLGFLLDENHRWLQEMTVSEPALDRLVAAAKGAGALGAKLSGAGRGGNMIALVRPVQHETVRQALLDAGAVRVLASTLAASIAA
ncbi:MAG: mevalonate kinase, partial [Anaerolineae bacterium]|nr:mevalonate kinase [Anaerolineae bacterium]